MNIPERVAGYPEAAADAAALAAIRDAQEQLHGAETRLRSAVTNARRGGSSWQAIGEALGVTRQAAFKRFTTTDEPAPEDGDMKLASIDLSSRTEMVFRSLDEGDYEAVKALMTYGCSRILSKRKVMKVWQQVTTASGRLEACADTVVHTHDGRNSMERMANQLLATGPVVHTTLRLEAGEWSGRVAYSGTGKITGLLIAPLGATELPF